MSDHTPTPWRVEEGADLIWGACNPDDHSSFGMGYSIVEGKIPGWKPYKPDYDERAANAAFIVKAVNAYDEMVRILKAIDESWSETFEEGPDGDYGVIALGEKHKTFWRDARAIIALTSGQRKV